MYIKNYIFIEIIFYYLSYNIKTWKKNLVILLKMYKKYTFNKITRFLKELRSFEFFFFFLLFSARTLKKLKLKNYYSFDWSEVCSLSSRIRVTSFSTAGSSGLFLIRYLAKKRERVACFSTFLFQALFLIFFFDFDVFFC